MKYLLFFIFLSQPVLANFDNTLQYSFGIYGSSLTENDSSISQTDTSVEVNDAVTSSTSEISAISNHFQYEYVYNSEYTLTTGALFPLISSDGTGVYSLDFGGNWYLNGVSSRFRFSINNNEFKMVPKLRYYVGGSIGLTYEIFTPASAKKTDVLFNNTARGGGYYSLNDDYSIKSELNIGRGSGVITSSTNFGILIGVSKFI